MMHDLKERVCEINKRLTREGLAVLTWGNASAIDRSKGIVAIKPSGISPEKMRPDDIVLVDLDGNIVEGDLRPSSDTNTHLEIYKSFKVGAIIHTHSPHATAFAQGKVPILCLGTTHADYFYGEVPVIRDLTREEIENDYEKNVGRVIAEEFQRRELDPLTMPSCLVPSHGPFVWSENIDKAIYIAIVLEQVAKMQFETMLLNPKIRPIPSYLLDRHYKRKHGKGAYYGQPHH